jgi:hypothetical protein
MSLMCSCVCLYPLCSRIDETRDLYTALYYYLIHSVYYSFIQLLVLLYYIEHKKPRKQWRL